MTTLELYEQCMEDIQRQLVATQAACKVKDAALKNLYWATSERDKKNRIRQFDKFMDDAKDALAIHSSDVELRKLIAKHIRLSAGPISARWAYAIKIEEGKEPL